MWVSRVVGLFQVGEEAHRKRPAAFKRPRGLDPLPSRPEAVIVDRTVRGCCPLPSGQRRVNAPPRPNIGIVLQRPVSPTSRCIEFQISIPVVPHHSHAQTPGTVGLR